MNHSLFRSGPAHRSLLRLGTITTLATTLLSISGVASAQVTPPPPGPTVSVTYDSLSNTIYIGDDYNPADPTQKDYVGWPSHPNAPKSKITLPEVDAALAAQGQPDLIDNQGSVYTLKVDTVIRQNARLELTNATVTELRLDSSTNRPAFPFLTKLIARGGYLLIQDTKVTSWNGSGPDMDINDGRSYLLAEVGGRMDVIRSEVSYLGYADGEPSGMAWRKPATEGLPTNPDVIKTGATGSIIDSNIHHNYFGQYSYQAYGLKATGNQVHDNILYGFDPHDDSTGFEFAYNTVYNNGKHGIIFSRRCVFNRIHHNVVYNNAQHGIMLDRGSDNNLVEYNESYNNSDGMAIFQSTNNTIRYNTFRDNEVGIRVNATYFPGDEFDGTSTNNKLVSNTIQRNSLYGIYLYERADKNDIEGNTIIDNFSSGVYIKTGANHIKNNVIRTNGAGITVVGGEQYATGTNPPPVAASGKPGQDNTIQGNTIEANDGAGMQFKGAIDNLVGVTPKPDPAQENAAEANTINNNGSHGISFGINDGTPEKPINPPVSSTKNIVYRNTIQGNGAAGNGDGVISKGAGVIKNKISKNSISGNTRSGIRNDDGAAENIQPPTITSTAGANPVTGQLKDINGQPKGGVTIEVYRDLAGQGNRYLGSTVTGSDGNWSFTLPPNDDPNAGAITALAIDPNGNTSAFGGVASGGVGAAYQILSGANGELTINVTGPGAVVALPDIERAVKTLSPTANLVENQGSGVWQLNASLKLNRAVTLTLTPATVTWLKLTSQANDIHVTAEGTAQYNYKSFVKLITYNGGILIDGVRVTSWDPAANTYDTDVSNGRAYILAKYNARLDVKNADLSYLGSADGESYGVSWRDINDSENPNVLLARVTGEVTNSTFSYNYFGIYTFQASNMKFTGNKFHHNIGYGADPHDFTNHTIFEHNEFFENGNHGWICSRGCSDIIVRNNKSYNNKYTVGTDDRSAHGFMLDPGSPNSRFPQVSSFNNTIENNEAWGNDGYGLRIVYSITNTVKANVFRNNQQGITLEKGSTGNIITGNTITNNQIYGIYATGGSDGNDINNNTIAANGKHGIYIKTGKNKIVKNNITDNGSIDASGPVGAGIAFLKESEFAATAADLTPPGSSVSLAAADPDLVAAPAAVTEVEGNQILQNTVLRNKDDGIELKSAYNTEVTANDVGYNGTHGIYLTNGSSQNMIKQNKVMGNAQHGIRVNGSDTSNNTIAQNSVTGNCMGGIVLTSNANSDIKPPVILSRDGNKITGKVENPAPGMKVELFSDPGGQGMVYETSVNVKEDGTFTATRGWKQPNVNATVTDPNGNTSAFSFNVPRCVGSLRAYLPAITRSK